MSFEPGTAGSIGPGNFLKDERTGTSLLLQSLSLGETSLGTTGLNPCFLPRVILPLAALDIFGCHIGE